MARPAVREFLDGLIVAGWLLLALCVLILCIGILIILVSLIKYSAVEALCLAWKVACS